MGRGLSFPMQEWGSTPNCCLVLSRSTASFPTSLFPRNVKVCIGDAHFSTQNRSSLERHAPREPHDNVRPGRPSTATAKKNLHGASPPGSHKVHKCWVTKRDQWCSEFRAQIVRIEPYLESIPLDEDSSSNSATRTTPDLIWHAIRRCSLVSPKSMGDVRVLLFSHGLNSLAFPACLRYDWRA
jgi:hypothetical protein